MVQTTTLRIAGMSCGACVRHVIRAIEGMNGVVHVDVDFQTNRAVVEHLPDSADEPALIAAITDAGYSAAAIDRGTSVQGLRRAEGPVLDQHRRCGSSGLAKP